MTRLAPMESEFNSTEEAEAYDRWFRAKVQEAMADSSAKLSHDEAMATVRELIEVKRRATSGLRH